MGKFYFPVQFEAKVIALSVKSQTREVMNPPI